jgi:glycosyltransferase involved in cell wall biosynthesis
MNLLILNTSDNNGGAAIATYRLHRGLRSIGVNSSLMVQDKGTDDFTVIGPKTTRQIITAYLRPYWERWNLRAYPKRERVIFSSAALPDKLACNVNDLSPDIVHLFWVNLAFMKIETLSRFNSPIVWTLHDMWPFTGGCHYDNECGRFCQSCGRCPALGSDDERDLSRKIWERKKKSWAGLPIVVVATSHWLADMARASSLFKDQRIEVIPNGIDTEKYKPLDQKMARAAFGLPQDKHLILFSAFSATTDKRKGNHLLMPALAKMAREGWGSSTELVIIGASAPETPPELGMRVHYVGNLHDEISQVLLYSAVDVTVAPSMQENLSNVVVESLACGTPIVAFDIGGMPDMINHQQSGYLATPFEPEDLAAGVMWVLEDKVRHDMLARHARQMAVEKYALESVSRQYLALYQSILE